MARHARPESPSERLVLFSDAVIAISITLLAIDLPVPDGVHSAHALGTFLDKDKSHYVAFIVSFGVIAVAWRTHHRAMRLIDRVDGTLELLNFIWLLTIILVPFAAKLLFQPHKDAFVHACYFGFYALLEAIGNGAIMVMIRHSVERHHTDPSTRQDRSDLRWGTLAFVIGFGLSVPVFFATTYAWVLWAVGPVVAGQLRRRFGQKYV